MKKTVFTILAALALLMPGTAAAQDLFNHLAVNAHVATTGVGVELSTPITKFITMRAGVTCMPCFSFSAEVDGQYYVNNTQRDFTVDLDANLKRTQGSVIFNVYPLAKAKVCSSFFLAAGLYFGGDKLVQIKGHCDDKTVNDLKQLGGTDSYIELGDYIASMFHKVLSNLVTHHIGSLTGCFHEGEHYHSEVSFKLLTSLLQLHLLGSCLHAIQRLHSFLYACYEFFFYCHILLFTLD